jgi:hypothetical protein
VSDHHRQIQLTQTAQVEQTRLPTSTKAAGDSSINQTWAAEPGCGRSAKRAAACRRRGARQVVDAQRIDLDLANQSTRSSPWRTRGYPLANIGVTPMRARITRVLLDKSLRCWQRCGAATFMALYRSTKLPSSAAVTDATCAIGGRPEAELKVI